jgi:hypothetical protein
MFTKYACIIGCLCNRPNNSEYRAGIAEKQEVHILCNVCDAQYALNKGLNLVEDAKQELQA